MSLSTIPLQTLSGISPQTFLGRKDMLSLNKLTACAISISLLAVVINNGACLLLQVVCKGLFQFRIVKAKLRVCMDFWKFLLSVVLVWHFFFGLVHSQNGKLEITKYVISHFTGLSSSKKSSLFCMDKNIVWYLKYCPSFPQMWFLKEHSIPSDIFQKPCSSLPAKTSFKWHLNSEQIFFAGNRFLFLYTYEL